MTKSFTVSDALLSLITVGEVEVLLGGVGLRFTLENGFHSVTDEMERLFDKSNVTSIKVYKNGHVTVRGNYTR